MTIIESKDELIQWENTIGKHVEFYHNEKAGKGSIMGPYRIGVVKKINKKFASIRIPGWTKNVRIPWCDVIGTITPKGRKKEILYD